MTAIALGIVAGFVIGWFLGAVYRKAKNRKAKPTVDEHAQQTVQAIWGGNPW